MAQAKSCLSHNIHEKATTLQPLMCGWCPRPEVDQTTYTKRKSQRWNCNFSLMFGQIPCHMCVHVGHYWSSSCLCILGPQTQKLAILQGHATPPLLETDCFRLHPPQKAVQRHHTTMTFPSSSLVLPSTWVDSTGAPRSVRLRLAHICPTWNVDESKWL